jgi:lauroyl/myristoyl acyltransferase
LICPHHWNQRLAFLRLAEERELAMVLYKFTTSPKATATAPNERKASLTSSAAHVEEVSVLLQRAFRGRLFPANPMAARAALQHVRAGGSVVMAPDVYPGTSITGSILGRQLPLALGPAWVARKANAPLIPFVVLPFERGRWRLWCGSPVDPTKNGLEHAMSHAISLSPTNWMYWDNWGSAPG